MYVLNSNETVVSHDELQRHFEQSIIVAIITGVMTLDELDAYESLLGV